MWNDTEYRKLERRLRSSVWQRLLKTIRASR